MKYFTEEEKILLNNIFQSDTNINTAKSVISALHDLIVSDENISIESIVMKLSNTNDTDIKHLKQTLEKEYGNIINKYSK